MHIAGKVSGREIKRKTLKPCIAVLYCAQIQLEQDMNRRQTHRFWMLVIVLALFAQLAPAQAPTGPERWLATWGAALQQPAANGAFSNQTVRMLVRASVGGRRVRVQLSNSFASAPVVLGPVHIALHGQGSAIVNGSDRALLFAGK